MEFREPRPDREPSEASELLECSLVADVARVQRRRGLEEHDLDFLVRDRAMLHPARYDDKLTRPQLDDAIAQLQTKVATMHEKELIFVLVVMPHERTLELCELDLLAVQLTNDLGTPVVGKRRELF